MCEEEDRGRERHKDIWDIIKALGPAIIAAAVAIVGSSYNYQQTQLSKSSQMREAYTRIMTERENSDNNIRAKMFEMVIGSMFDKQMRGEIQLDDTGAIKQRIMFLDLLSRNFDTVDIKPLFEDLDNELTKRLSPSYGFDRAKRGEVFVLRSELRRIGRNLSVKQLNALSALPGSVVKRVVIIEDVNGGLTAVPDENVNGNGTVPVEVKPQGINDGNVEVLVDYQRNKATDQGFRAPEFEISFYDLPYIDNSVLDKDMRIGVILTKYFNLEDLELYRANLDRKTVKEYEELKAGGIRRYAELRLIKFPAQYTGYRDRPYLQEVLQDLVDEQAKPQP